MRKKDTITHTNPQQTIGFELAKPEQSFSFDSLFLIFEIWLMGVTEREDAEAVSKNHPKINNLMC